MPPVPPHLPDSTGSDYQHHLGQVILAFNHQIDTLKSEHSKLSDLLREQHQTLNEVRDQVSELKYTARSFHSSIKGFGERLGAEESRHTIDYRSLASKLGELEAALQRSDKEQALQIQELVVKVSLLAGGAVAIASWALSHFLPK